MSRHFAWIVGWMVLSVAWVARAQDSTARSLVVVQKGTLPIVLTAPHGGRMDVPGAQERRPMGARFVTGADLNTDLLAQGIVAEMQKLTGQAPSLVMARFHRKFIDANRPAEEAYDSPASKPVYEHYHASVRAIVDELRARHPAPVLFDIHGQSTFADSILRGTRFGVTVKRMLQRAGAPSLTGPQSVFGQFHAMGYKIVPLNDTEPTARVEADRYSGGHTVAIYGSHNADGIDAIQLEFGSQLRAREALDKTAKDTAKAIVAFYEHFIKNAKAK
jgi:N-formylglutamate amidohydrolase